MFDDDIWNFTAVVGLPVQMGKSSRRLDFTAIRAHRWQLVAKELIMALLAPHHLAVAPLPQAYRTPLHPSRCIGRLHEISGCSMACAEGAAGWRLRSRNRKPCGKRLSPTDIAAQFRRPPGGIIKALVSTRACRDLLRRTARLLRRLRFRSGADAAARLLVEGANLSVLLRMSARGRWTMLACGCFRRRCSGEYVEGCAGRAQLRP